MRKTGSICLSRRSLTIEVDVKEGFVSLHVELGDRLVAASLAQAATDLLQRNVAFKSQSARNNLDFIERQFESKRQEFEQIQINRDF